MLITANYDSDGAVGTAVTAKRLCSYPVIVTLQGVKSVISTSLVGYLLGVSNMAMGDNMHHH